MKKFILRLSAAGILLMIFNRAGYSQSANPLAPPLPSPRVGVEAGITINQQSGTFLSDCGCAFSSGSGNGILVSGIGEMFLTPKWELMGKVSYRYKSLTSNNSNDTDEMVLDPTTNMIIEQPVPLNENATAKISYLTIVPMIRYNVYQGLFLAAGPSIGFAMSSDLSAQESFAQGGYTFKDGGTTRSIQSGPVPNINSFNVAFDGEIGYTFPLSETLFFVPSFSFDLPLTSVESGTDWKIMTYQITGAIEWSLHRW